jgi:biotin synthase
VNQSDLVKRIIDGYRITRDEAVAIAGLNPAVIIQMAGALQREFNQKEFEFCAVINAKSGKCSEDCKFCAQSNRYHTGAKIYPLLDKKIVLEKAGICARKKIHRFSLVTSGKALTTTEVEKICDIVAGIRETAGIHVCASLGLLSAEQYAMLKKAGVTRIHNNLETSERYFGQVCSTHTYSERLAAIEAAKEKGLEICSGGIIGIGETLEDRIDLALEVRRIKAVSMPVNILIPVPGTPFHANKILSKDEVEKTVAIMKIINPDVVIRMAGGRMQLPDKGVGCFLAGSSAAITGNMLTTDGTTIEEDVKMVESLGFTVRPPFDDVRGA